MTNASLSLSILSANVGTYHPCCALAYKGKLCRPAVEEAIRQTLQQRQPDLVFLQEVLPPDLARRTPWARWCPAQPSTQVPQVRRLLGEGYTIVCDQHRQWVCVAVKTHIGTLEGCPPGELCTTERTAPPLEGCDPGFKIMAATLTLPQGVRFDLVNVHLSSTSALCRARMLRQLFAGSAKPSSLLREEKVLIAGDFNFDPWRDKGEDVQVWQAYFAQGWRGRPFRYHLALREDGRPPVTLVVPLYKKRTVDWMVSNFAEGECVVLGETPGTSRLDGGKGMDHRALHGTLRIPVEA